MSQKIISNSTPSILALAQDPGGAAALQPVLSQLSQSSDVDLTVLAHHQAWQVFSAEGLNFIKCDKKEKGLSNWYAYAYDWIDKSKANLVLTATSNKKSLEKAFIRAARKRDIRCLTVLDSWTEYRNRFLEPGEQLLSKEILPDYITVIDDFTAEEMHLAGFPAEILYVTGQPSLDKFIRWIKTNSSNDSKKYFRNELGVNTHNPLIVYFSQAIADVYPPGSNEYRGYTEYDVLSTLLQSLTGIQPEPHLAIKPHPKARASKFRAMLSNASTPVSIVDTIQTDHLIAAADVIVGMTSIVLVKGFLAGRKTLSIQPNRRGQDELIISRLGLIESIINVEDAPSILRDAVSGQENIILSNIGPTTWTDGQAVERIISIIKKVLREQ